MLRIACLGNDGLTERLQKVVQEKCALTPITQKVFGASNLLNKVRGFISATRHYKYVLIYAFPHMWAYFFLAKLTGKKVIIYWIGTDCFLLQNNPKRYIIKRGDINLAHSVSLKKELREYNIETILLTILPQGIDLSLAKMPPQHAVLFYIPEGREQFYGYDWIIKLIEAFPNLPFHIVANGKKELFPQKNVIVHGKVPLAEMEKIYDEISIVLRFPQHDSLSISIMEAMFKAKIIIYRYEQEETIQAKTLEAFIAAISEQIQLNPTPNLKAREYALKHFTPEIVRTQFDEIIRRYDLE